ncbi:DNA helicase [Malassezia brasiliensis]|uniref:DNA replication ATP-dependent helicase/nuclease DNA2 n=1 Tax=Malassezia brasiliensis TaxID=1821822 RepID=A0AAF0DWE5_9BASI|nr:DNA helicase [Malassezia brasiliensis]
MPPDASHDLLGALFAGRVCAPSLGECRAKRTAADTQRAALGERTNSAPTTARPVAPRPAPPAARGAPVEGYALDDSSHAAVRARCASALATRRFARAVVTHCYERDVPDAGARAAREKVLELELESGATAPPEDTLLNASLYYQPEMHTGAVSGVALLRDEWLTTPVRAGDVVHLLGAWERRPYVRQGARRVADDDDDDDADLWDSLADPFAEADDAWPTMVLASFGHARACAHLLVVHPDVIVSASSLASAASCMRRPMLQERVKTATSTTYAAVLGNLVHGLLQACLVADAAPGWERLGNFAPAFVAAEIERQLVANRAALSLVAAESAAVRAELEAAVPALVSFAERYLARRDGATEPLCAVDDRRASGVALRITRVLGVEEDVVSPMYGLKGRVDACVEALVDTDGVRRRALLPLEIKTGRLLTSTEHAAQTSMYTLLLSDAWGIAVDAGLLLYTQTSSVVRVPQVLREVRSLLLARNEMAAYKTHLPALDAAPPAPAAPGADAPAVLPPTIDRAHACTRCYARDACMLYRAAVERVDDRDSPIAALYAAHAAGLDAADRAFFQHWDALLSHEEQSLARFRSELWTLPAAARERLGRCVAGLEYDEAADAWAARGAARALHTVLAADDVVLLSTCAPHAAMLSRARVAWVSATHVALRTERDWRAALRQMRTATGAGAWTFRIDHDELSSMLSVPRYNVACLFYPAAPPRIAQLRARVVHRAPPQWRARTAHDDALLAAHTAACNDEQRRAVAQALTARDYALVLGMPGTGKSTTLAALVHLLVAAGQSVLLCSYTHSAVDTVLAKLGAGLDVLRIGAPHRVHPRVRACTLDARLGRDARVEAFDALVAGAQVVAATCLATNDAVLARRTFDVCIVDEASQITTPTCLGPLRMADRFVLVGDHHQLAPLVREEAAAAGGLATSLFQTLCEAHPHAVVSLTRQYRMNAAIMALSNALVYRGALQCGSAAVADAALAADTAADVPRWIAPLLAPDVRAAWLDTDALGAREARHDGTLENAAEAALVGTLCAAFARAGVAHTAIGVLTPYRQQVRHLRAAVAPDVEVLTVDQAQGRDWPLVLASMVRSNDAQQAGSLLRETRRINVLLTRAKHKLLLVGSARTLAGRDADAARPLARVLAQLHAADAVVPVPADALAGACADPRATATHTSPSKARAVKTARTARGVAAEVLAEHGLEELGI